MEDQSSESSASQQPQQESQDNSFAYPPGYDRTANYPYYYPTAGAAGQEGLPENYSAAAHSAVQAGFRRTRGGSDLLGPYFKPTKNICALFSLDRTRTYSVRIYPRLDRGFFVADNDWTCYRRNYFQVSCSFTAFDASGAKLELPCLVEVEGRGLRTATEFQLHLVARTSNASREIELVQHTAKRDKGPQMTPQPKRIEPSDLNPTQNYTPGRNEPDSATVVSWERVQFKSATANNGKRRAAQQYHVLYVELLAVCDDGYLARVAHAESAPLVVRGRAPGHYAAMASKEMQDHAEQFPFNYNPNDPNSYYHHMMQAGYYYGHYYSPALWQQNAQNAVGNMYYGMSPEQLAAAAQITQGDGETPAETPQADNENSAEPDQSHEDVDATANGKDAAKDEDEEADDQDDDE